MTRAPLANVAALREPSVLLATVIGALVLTEAFGLQWALGILIIVAGVIALRFGWAVRLAVGTGSAAQAQRPSSGVP